MAARKDTRKDAEKLAEREPRGPRLDTPKELRKGLIRSPIRYDSDAFGIFAERFARFMGTAKFLFYMTVFVIVWVAANVVGFIHHWDKYPFILLNLFFSTQASYAAPLILLAQNRQEDRDRVVTERDRRANAASHADMEFLAREVAALRMALGEVATRDFVRSELRALLAELVVDGVEANDEDVEGADHGADQTGPDVSAADELDHFAGRSERN